MWRPAEWENPSLLPRGLTLKQAIEQVGVDKVPSAAYAYEAGASAMLEALKGDRYVDFSDEKYQYGVVLNDLPPKFKMKKGWKGWVVFIPDEEKTIGGVYVNDGEGQGHTYPVKQRENGHIYIADEEN